MTMRRRVGSWTAKRALRRNNAGKRTATCYNDLRGRFPGWRGPVGFTFSGAVERILLPRGSQSCRTEDPVRDGQPLPVKPGGTVSGRVLPQLGKARETGCRQLKTYNRITRSRDSGTSAFSALKEHRLVPTHFWEDRTWPSLVATKGR